MILSFSLPSAGITGIYHHTQISLSVFKINIEYHNYFNIMASLIFLNKDT